MPFLTVGGTTVPVTAEGQGATQARQPIGTQQRTFDGTMRSGIRRWPRAYDIRTIPMDLPAAAALVAALTAPPPIVATGDIFFDPIGANTVHLTGLAAEFSRIGESEAVTLRFQLAEA